MAEFKLNIDTKEIRLGDRVRDIHTDFAGKVTGRAVYIDGTVNFLVEARSKPGKLPDKEWIDRARLVVTVKQKPVRVAKRSRIKAISNSRSS